MSASYFIDNDDDDDDDDDAHNAVVADAAIMTMVPKFLVIES